MSELPEVQLSAEQAVEARMIHEALVERPQALYFRIGRAAHLIVHQRAEIERLQDRSAALEAAYAAQVQFTNDMIERAKEAEARVAELERAAERQEAALQRIRQWAEAYPLDVFPEPDWKRSAEVLKAVGLSLDRISASNMRHVITQVRGIVDGALSETTGDGWDANGSTVGVP